MEVAFYVWQQGELVNWMSAQCCKAIAQSITYFMEEMTHDFWLVTLSLK